MAKNKLLGGHLDALKKASGQGLETVDPTQDLALSRIAIAHSESDEVDEDNAKHIEGLKPGDIFDATFQKVLARYSEKESILFIPIVYRKRWPEWGDRQARKGIIEMHDSPDILDKCQPGARRNPKLRFLPNGNEVRETAYFFGWTWHPATGIRRECYIPMSSKRLANARLWLDISSTELIPETDTVAPFYFRVYELTTRKDFNAAGKWHIWKINRNVDITEVAKDSADLTKIMEEAEVINDIIDEHPILAPGRATGEIAAGSADDESAM